MMLVCSSCNSRYLVNSGDLKPDGRVVRCAKCDHEWFQEPNLSEEGTLESSILSISEEENNKLINEKKSITNLPSTYIKEEKASIFNSILIIYSINWFVLDYQILINYICIYILNNWSSRDISIMLVILRRINRYNTYKSR